MQLIIENFLNGYIEEILYILYVSAILAGISVIVNKNPITSILCLIGLFGSISIYLNFIGLTFIGLSYIIIYLGAISILFLFIVMMINIKNSELQNENWDSMPLALFIGLIFSNYILPGSNSNEIVRGGEFNFNGVYKVRVLNNVEFELYNTAVKRILDNIFYVSSNNWDNNVIDISHISSIGSVLYSSYNIWLLKTSFILLLAMIGAIVIVNNNNTKDSGGIAIE